MDRTGPWNDVHQIASLVERWLENHFRLFLVAASALSILTFSGYSHAKVPWWDEVLTMTIARQPTIAKMWAALYAGFEPDPPSLEYITRFLVRVFGDNVFWARLPAILGFTLACGCLAILVRRHTSAIYGAAVFYFPFSTTLRVRAMDARPYGMMLGLSALALLCWDRLGDEQLPRRTAWRVAFTLSLTAALFTHFYSIWLLLALGMGELCRWILRRKIDWWIPLCVGIALLPWIACLPMAASAARILEVKMGHFHGHVAFKDLYDFFEQQVESLPLAGILVFLLLGLAIAGNGEEIADRRKFFSLRHRDLLAATAGFLLIPVFGYIAALVAIRFFVGYHLLIATFGIVIGIPLLLYVLSGPRSRVVGLCLFTALLAHGLFVNARGLSGFARREHVYPNLEKLQALAAEPNPEIVVTCPGSFFPYYEATRSRSLVYLTDGQKSLQQIGNNSMEIILRELTDYVGINVQPFDSYVAGRPHYYVAVFAGGACLDDWQYNYLLTRAHARLWWLGVMDGVDLYRVELPRRSEAGS